MLLTAATAAAAHCADPGSLAIMDLKEYVKTLHADAGSARGVGSARHLGPASALRGVSTVSTGVSQGLARVIHDQGLTARDGNPLMKLEVSSMILGGVEVLLDRLDMWAHGNVLTHLDAPNHVVIDDVAPATGDSADSDNAWLHWADTGFVTRAVLFDVPAHRGIDYVPGDAPVTGAELAEMEAKLGYAIEPGDALLLYSGRDRFEAEWTGDGPAQIYASVAQDTTPWFADHQFSVLCWDLVDSPPTENFGIHLLIWAQGLAIIDNCEFGRAVEIFRDSQRTTALLSVGPIPIAQATGCLINPILTF